MANETPRGAELQTVYLLHASSPRERAILERWVDAAPAGGASARRLPADDAALEPLLAGAEPCFLVPLRVLWEDRSPVRGFGSLLRRLLLGDPRRPGPLLQWLILRRAPGSARALVADGAALAQLQMDFALQHAGQRADPALFAQFVRRQALLALERAERNVRGARYKVPRLLEQEVLSKPRLVTALAEEAERSGRDLQAVFREARGCLQEMAPTHSTLALDIMAAVGRYLYTRGFDPAIDYLEEDLARIRRLGKSVPIAFLMTHKSHIDGFLLVTMFYDLDMPPVHLFGGINMSFFGLGAMGRRSGAIFIRRSMGGDNVYKAVFKQYIDYLAEKRFPLLWALEGTRSRTGKLMPPRYGLISYVVESYVRAASTDMILMPVSIAYDQVPEVGDYIAEQKGVRKRPESASWFLQYVSGLRNPHGRIHVRFGEGVKLSDVLGPPRPDLVVGTLDVQKIAFRLSVDANNVTPVLGTALIAFVLCAAGRRALTRTELVVELRALARLVHQLQVPAIGDVTFATDEALERTLAQLVATRVLQRHEGAAEPLYAVAENAAMAAAYYRNASAHFFVIGAIAELALARCAIDERSRSVAALQAEAVALRDLLKFEFFFHDKTEFLAEIEAYLGLRAPAWRAAFDGDPATLHRLLWELDPLLAPGTLRPFLESYLVVAEALLGMPDGAEDIDPRVLLGQALALGRERWLQQRIHSEESLARIYLENGIQLVQARGLLRGSAAGAGRTGFHAELGQLARRTAFLAGIAENRRLGIEPAALPRTTAA